VMLWRPVSRVFGRFTPATLRSTLRQAGFGRCEVHECLWGLGLLARARRA
jgi:hypothetical protein